MTTEGPNYWPFPVLHEDQLTEQQQKEIRFLETAYRLGYRPCLYLTGGGEYLARSEQGREGWIISRGGYRNGAPTRWEVGLDDQSGRVASYWVSDFDSAAGSILKWLAGKDAPEAVEAAKPWIIKGPRVSVSVATQPQTDS